MQAKTLLNMHVYMYIGAYIYTKVYKQMQQGVYINIKNLYMH